MLFINVLLFYLAILRAEASPALPYIATMFSQISQYLNNVHLSNCPLAKTNLPSHGSLPGPSPGLSLKYVTIGRGTQSYTCQDDSSTTVPKSVSAVATLVDVSCLAASNPTLLHNFTPVVKEVQSEALPFLAVLGSQLSSSATKFILGKHQFNAAGQPTFDLRLAGGSDWVASKRAASSDAPDRSTVNVPWLKLTSVSGNGIKEVYRLHTVGGQPPANCQKRKGTFQVDYAAEYWFYG
ncbi:malate dehydrogenase [Aspergillus nomiae NRRL 13137]|uniref:Malate dehydrogenase n=1 Tax=Aspergillus nomiae NRRL (strain ATCC 15546 / NRRL 13137 / CBS 260.88 / M93) TaxID=1509407 RepID=A0A0L1JJQ7_ASPN3|nr:malate dehydrogenase [Aspergillus nomiae NRRL 13137]KNG91658.1 malate dehydrogenase [Aspergillus nomiae NRRL 13137]